jgi:hypothetical protein
MKSKHLSATALACTVIAATIAVLAGVTPPASAEDALRALQNPGVTAPSAPAQRSVGGKWSGRYSCAQGITGARVVLSQDGSRALFHFFAVPENRGVPDGCFRMSGVFNSASNTLDLTAGDWIIRPRNYVSANVSGLIDANRQSFLGRLIGPPGCTVITLTKEPASRPLPSACERGLP